MKKTHLLLLLSISMSGLVSCGTDISSSNVVETTNSSIEDSASSSKNYSLEENFAYWRRSRDNTLSYIGDYTFSRSNFEKDAYGNQRLTATKESNSGNQLYREVKFKRGEELIRSSLTVIKNVECEDGKTRTKLYKEESVANQSKKEGQYVNPNYINKYDYAYYPPNRFLEDSGLDIGDTYEELVNNATLFYQEDLGVTLSKIEFNRTNEDFLSLNLEANLECINENISDVSYVNSLYSFSINAVVNKDYLSSLSFHFKERQIYKDKELIETNDIFCSVSYSFDNEYFFSINIDTDETPNNYKRIINFHVEGYPFIWSIDDSCAENELSIDEVNNYLKEETNFIVRGVNQTNDDKLDLFKVYTDEEMTNPFVSTDLDEIDLYIKLTPTAERGIVLTLLENQGRTIVNIIYTRKLGSEFRTDNIMEYCTLISIDGEKVKEGERPSFTVSESKVYIVIFSSANN